MYIEGITVDLYNGRFLSVAPTACKCRLCRFYHPDKSECRINYPKPEGWVKVAEDDWCGCFEIDKPRLRVANKNGVLPVGVTLEERVTVHYPEVPQPGFWQMLFGK